MEKASVITIIQARMSSSRLPGKVLMPLAGKPLIWHVYEQAKLISEADLTVVATSLEPSDDPLVEFCRLFDIPFYRGSLFNVLSRFEHLIDKYGCDYFVRITGDSPFICGDFVDFQVRSIRDLGADWFLVKGSPIALSGQSVHSSSSLRTISANSRHPDDLEHVGSRYLIENSSKFRIAGIEVPERYMSFDRRLAIDELVDYQTINDLYNDLWMGSPIALDDAMNWFQSSVRANINTIRVRNSAINDEVDQAKKRLFFTVSDTLKWIPGKANSYV